MEGITVHEYKGETGYRGCIEPDDRAWILFIRNDGKPEFFAHRDPETGAVIQEGWTMEAFLVAFIVKCVKLAPEIYKQFKESGLDAATALRRSEVRVYVAFGGGEGGAVKEQRTIEALLPADE